ncbi:MAG: hypothetical protein EXR75_07070 [Myxococcales bacterium]|nr:hypothetical protein [Myxococcales bacterium]
MIDFALRTRTLAALGLAIVVSVAVAPTGCSTIAGEPCVGGVLGADGSCAPKCDPAQCVTGNVCVDNACRLTCDSLEDCNLGTQSCTLSVEDDTKRAVTVCLGNGEQPPLANGYPKGIEGEGCPFGAMDCSATACANGLYCDPAACGGKPDECVLDDAACGDIERCNIGKCTADGSRCTVTTCDATECAPLSCLTTGEGDANAYCAHHDCTADAECGAGYYCGVTRDAHDQCGNTCAGGKCSHDAALACMKDGDCQKGNNTLCGKTLLPCLDLNAAPASTSYFEGSRCVLRKTCLRRDECAPCNSHLDCSLGTASMCVTAGSANVCARFCTADANCRSDQACLAGGKTCGKSPALGCAAAEDCPTEGDTCVDRMVCVPRSGGCHAESDSAEKFCRACVNDTDCGDKDSKYVCSQLGPGHGACFDLFATKCATDADCPTSPSGAHGRCLNTADGVAVTDAVYHTCYFAKFGDSYGCFP